MGNYVIRVHRHRENETMDDVRSRIAVFLDHKGLTYEGEIEIREAVGDERAERIPDQLYEQYIATLDVREVDEGQADLTIWRPASS